MFELQPYGVSAAASMLINSDSAALITTAKPTHFLLCELPAAPTKKSSATKRKRTKKRTAIKSTETKSSPSKKTKSHTTSVTFLFVCEVIVKFVNCPVKFFSWNFYFFLEFLCLPVFCRDFTVPMYRARGNTGPWRGTGTLRVPSVHFLGNVNVSDHNIFFYIPVRCPRLLQQGVMGRAKARPFRPSGGYQKVYYPPRPTTASSSSYVLLLFLLSTG